jgi:hypothetical protein
VLEHDQYGNESRAFGGLTHARITMATAEEYSRASPRDEGIPMIAIFAMLDN